MKGQEYNANETFLATYIYSFFTICLAMSKSKEVVILVTALSLAIAIIVQGSVFDYTRAMGASLASLASAITHIQNDGKTITGNNPNRPSTPINQQSSSDIIDTSFKNIALQSNSNDPTTQTTNLTSVFKQVENSVVQITAKTPNPNLQVIINGNPLGVSIYQIRFWIRI